MLGTLVQKEIRAGLFSFRFAAVFALLIVVVPVTILVLTNDAVRKVDEFSARRSGIEDYLKNYAHFNRLQNVVAPAPPPLPAYALFRGVTSDVNIEGFDNDPLPVIFPLIDLTFVIAILLSLAALVFTYDAVCGEKEDGTLKLMLAGGLARWKILLGKVLGGAATLAFPFLTSLGLGLLVVVLNPRLDWRGTDWAALALVLLGAAVYVVLFVVLGVLISARHQSSSSSIMTSLFAWVLLILVIPNLSPYLASLLSPAPSRIKTYREADRLTDVERDDLGKKLMAENVKAVTAKYPVLAERLSEAETKERVTRDPAYREAYEARTKAVQAAWNEANRIQGAKRRALLDDLDLKEKAQTRLARNLSLVSPLADFTYLATDLTSTGLRNMAQFALLSRLWGRSYSDYVQAKTGALQKDDPTRDVWNSPVDVSDMPRFVFREESIGGRIKAALIPFAVLAVMALALFAAAYASFVRYDAR
jgi:ABC-type transport system involved in multi-copper enzyme maturation permease subunit